MWLWKEVCCSPSELVEDYELRGMMDEDDDPTFELVDIDMNSDAKEREMFICFLLKPAGNTQLLPLRIFLLLGFSFRNKAKDSIRLGLASRSSCVSLIRLLEFEISISSCLTWKVVLWGTIWYMDDYVEVEKVSIDSTNLWSSRIYRVTVFTSKANK